MATPLISFGYSPVGNASFNKLVKSCYTYGDLVQKIAAFLDENDFSREINQVPVELHDHIHALYLDAHDHEYADLFNDAKDKLFNDYKYNFDAAVRQIASNRASELTYQLYRAFIDVINGNINRDLGEEKVSDKMEGLFNDY